MMELSADNFVAKLDEIAAQNNVVFDKLALAVSGGADSLALAYLAHKIREKRTISLVALTVNHNLRPEAVAEAQMVANLMKDWNIEHHVLEWKEGRDVTSGVEEKAREARYSLLENWCLQNDFRFLLTAHHVRDQAETFLMRLQRGAGVDGLSAMSDFTPRGAIFIVRPLLEVAPEDLKKLLKIKNVEWAEDASNRCEDYLRVRIRKFLPELEQKTGISVTRLAETAEVMRQTREYFDIEVKKFVSAHVRFYQGPAVSFSPSFFADLHSEIRRRVLASLIKQVGNKTYPPEYEELRRLMLNLQKKDFGGCTLGGCDIFLFQKRWWIVKSCTAKTKISSKDWEIWMKHNPQYKKMCVPYKLKCLLIETHGLPIEF